MAYNRLVFRKHAIQRMFQYGINEADIRHILKLGEVIKNYPEDTPYPSMLISGWCGSRPIHIVAADNHDDKETIIITTYEPDPGRWKQDFKKRKTQ